MEQFNIEGREIENEHLELRPKNKYFLGPDLVMKDCTLVLRVAARDLILIGPRLINCTIEVKKELKNFPWHHAVLRGCRFTGRMSGCDFGRKPGAETEGSIEDCDFTSASLDGCRFLGCDMSTLRLPSWPCFTIMGPVERSSELRALSWPGQLGIVIGTFAKYPRSTAAVTFSATSLAREFSTSEKELRAALERLDGVRY